EQVSLGDVISIDWHSGELGLTFLKEAEGALVPMASPATERLADAAVAAGSDARSVQALSAHAPTERFSVRPTR
ncbi:MAG: hypothetical protein WAN14_10495, partial [Candidatus Acidiferrales bacterium]